VLASSRRPVGSRQHQHDLVACRLKRRERLLGEFGRAGED